MASAPCVDQSDVSSQIPGPIRGQYSDPRWSVIRSQNRFAISVKIPGPMREQYSDPRTNERAVFRYQDQWESSIGPTLTLAVCRASSPYLDFLWTSAPLSTRILAVSRRCSCDIVTMMYYLALCDPAPGWRSAAQSCAAHPPHSHPPRVGSETCQ